MISRASLVAVRPLVDLHEDPVAERAEAVPGFTRVMVGTARETIRNALPVL
jgi:hypothetical protein